MGLSTDDRSIASINYFCASFFAKLFLIASSRRNGPAGDEENADRRGSQTARNPETRWQQDWSQSSEHLRGLRGGPRFANHGEFAWWKIRNQLVGVTETRVRGFHLGLIRVMTNHNNNDIILSAPEARKGFERFGARALCTWCTCYT